MRKDCNPQSALRITFCAALHAFLEAALEQKIQDVVLTANDAPAGYDRQRGVNYDIMVTLDSGRCVNVEMQAYNREYDYGKRAEYHVSRLETTYLRKGDGAYGSTGSFDNNQHGPGLVDMVDEAGGLRARPDFRPHRRRLKDALTSCGSPCSASLQGLQLFLYVNIVFLPPYFITLPAL